MLPPWNWAGMLGCVVCILSGIGAFHLLGLLGVPEDPQLLWAIDFGMVAAAVFGFHYDRLEQPAMLRSYFHASGALSEQASKAYWHGTSGRSRLHPGTRVAMFMGAPLFSPLLLVLGVSLLIWAVDFFGRNNAIPADAYVLHFGSLFSCCLFCYLYAFATARKRSLRRSLQVPSRARPDRPPGRPSRTAVGQPRTKEQVQPSSLEGYWVRHIRNGPQAVLPLRSVFLRGVFGDQSSGLYLGLFAADRFADLEDFVVFNWVNSSVMQSALAEGYPDPSWFRRPNMATTIPELRSFLAENPPTTDQVAVADLLAHVDLSGPAAWARDLDLISGHIDCEGEQIEILASTSRGFFAAFVADAITD